MSINSKSLPVEIRKSWEKARPVSEIKPKLEDAIKKLESDPSYHAEFLKADFVEEIYKAMEKEGINKKELAERMNRSRQYIGRVLNENANFTIETMAAFACALHMKIEINMVDRKQIIKKPEYGTNQTRVFSSSITEDADIRKAF